MRSPHTSYRWRGRERDIEPIKCMRSAHTSYRWRGERSHRAYQVYALTPHQLQVERRERHRGQSSGCAHHTQVTGWEEMRETIEPNQLDALTTNKLQVERRESHRAYQVYALTPSSATVEREREGRRDIEPNRVYALATHQLHVERRERHRANRVYALATHQLHVERRERET